MRGNINQLSREIKEGSFLALARGISIVENELPGYEELLTNTRANDTVPVVGITGPPGAGKSTLVNALLKYWLAENKKIAVIAVDPSSPFNYGALLGDRIRMSEFYTHPGIFIRSLASRGALGGLSPKIIEISSLVQQAPFDVVLIETVGVGQSEVEIAGLADCTIVALVPEAGDEVQALKAGIMEIADLFVVNKADRDSAEALYRHLRIMAHERAGDKRETPVVKTVATTYTGIAELAGEIDIVLSLGSQDKSKKMQLMAEKCWQLIQHKRMKDVSLKRIKEELNIATTQADFNLFRFVEKYTNL